jgi:hypothetical protein
MGLLRPLWNKNEILLLRLSFAPQGPRNDTFLWSLFTESSKIIYNNLLVLRNHPVIR